MDGGLSPRAQAAHARGHSALQERPGIAAFNAALLEAHPAPPPSPTSVLLIEEDPNDILLTERALRDVLGQVHVAVARSAAEARALIARGDILPELVLVGVEPRLGDIPGFLRWLGDGSGLPALPVVLLMSVDLSPRELLDGTAGPCRRIVRPLGLDAFVRALHRVLPM